MKRSKVPLAAASGEEFRENLRGTAPGSTLDAQASNAVRRLLPPEILAELTRLEPWRSSLAIVQTLMLIALTVGIVRLNFTW